MEHNKSSNSVAIIAIVVIVVLAGVLLYFLFGGPRDTVQSTPLTPATETNIQVDQPEATSQTLTTKPADSADTGASTDAKESDSTQ